MSGPQLKTENQIMRYRWTFRKDPLIYDIINYGVTMDFQKKYFIEPAESCSHWLKITLWKKLGRQVRKYRIAI